MLWREFAGSGHNLLCKQVGPVSLEGTFPLLLLCFIANASVWQALLAYNHTHSDLVIFILFFAITAKSLCL